MKKTKKALASLAIAGMTLSMLPFNALASGTVPTRLAGGTAAQTAVAIAEQTGWTGTAILASSASYGMVDALTSGPLASFLKAPVLLQEPGATLNADTKAELAKLNVKKVYVTSGTAVISQSVIKEMEAMGISVESLGGADRFETSVNIAKKMVALGAPVSKVAVAYGWLNQDALSIASIASASNSPILLTEKSELPASVKAFLATNASVTSSDVIGGTGVISDAVKAALPSATRHAGNTAYDTNNQVIQDFNSSLTYDKVYVASGVTGIDALAGAPLAAASKSAIVLTDGTAAAAAAFVHGKLATDSVVTALGGSAVVPEAVRAGVVSGVVTPPTGNLSVTSVSAVSVNGIKVVFNQAPADTSKVTFAVTRGTSPATVTPSWNDAKTEATLQSAGNFAEGDYTVAVKNDTTNLSTNTVSITSQRVGKISVDSNVLAVTSSGAIGYAGYHVYDQYGTDITTSYLAGASYIDWNCGVGTAVANGKGLLTITPFNTQTILTQYSTAVVTAVTKNQSIPASANVTLNISTTQGTISDITLNKITSASNAVPTVGDTEKYYIDFSAKDMAGLDTKSLVLMQKGLITSTNAQGSYSIITSNNQLVDVNVVADPTDDQKAALEVTIKDPTSYTLMQDQPITITASTYTGKTASFNFTLRRKQAVDTFTIMAPTSNIPSDKTGVVIPFAAYDQAGKQLTKYSDLKNLVTLSPGSGSTSTTGYLYLEENADGTASLKYDAPTVTGTASQQHTLTASVNSTGKFSSLTINVDVAAKVDSLKLDDSVIVPRLEVGAVKNLDFGFNDGGFQVVDQYGAIVDMQSKYVIGGATYFVEATSSNPGIVAVAGRAYAGHEISVTGSAAGSATVTFKLMSTTDNFVTKTDSGLSKSLSVSVLADKDITGYVLDKVAKPLYAIGTTSGAITAQQQDFDSAAQEPIVYGTTASGSKVVLKTANIISRTLSSSDFDYAVDDNNQTKVFARTFTDSAKKGSSATLTVTVMNYDDNRPHTATTTVTSVTDDAVAQSMGFYAQAIDRADSTNATGITYDGSTVTVSLTGTQSQFTTLSANATALNSSTPGSITATSVLNAIVGRDLTRFSASTGSSSNRGYVYLWAKDQYGSKAMNLSNIQIVQQSMTGGNATIDANNTLQFAAAPHAGDYLYISGISSNGLVTTVKIVFAN